MSELSVVCPAALTLTLSLSLWFEVFCLGFCLLGLFNFFICLGF